MITIEVFGPGCPRCEATLAAVREALQVLGIEATVTEIHDPKEMARHRVLFTPAIRIDGELKCTGRVPEVREVTAWLSSAAVAAKDA